MTEKEIKQLEEKRRLEIKAHKRKQEIIKEKEKELGKKFVWNGEKFVYTS